MSRFHLTQNGLDQLQQELQELSARRPEIIEAIAAAREQGDLKENSEYQSAKEEQSILENRIVEIEDIIRHHILINKNDSPSQTVVSLGSTVHLQSVMDTSKKIVEIVGAIEADPFKGRISDNSKVGQILLGKAVGEEISLPDLSGLIDYKITAIS